MSKFNKFSTLVNSLAVSDAVQQETPVASIATEPAQAEPAVTTEAFNVLPKVQHKVGEVFSIDNKQVKVVEVLESSLEGYTLHVKNTETPFDSFLV